MLNKSARNQYIVSVLLGILLPLVITTSISIYVSATNSTSGTNSSLMIWDNVDSEGGSNNKWTYDTGFNQGYDQGPRACDSKGSAEYTIKLFANYTNESIIDNTIGNCSIRFDENNTGTYTSWDNMTYNSTSELWEYNRSFTSDGNLSWQVNCTSNFSHLSVLDKVFIKNTGPCINYTNPSWELLPIITVTEDTVYHYNFSERCTDDDLNDIPNLVYNYTPGSNTTLTNFIINTSNGNITINITHDDYTGDDKQVLLTVRDELAETSAFLVADVTAVNDPPQFIGLPSPIIADEEIEETGNITATDEEGDTPYTFNITFINCTRDIAGYATGSTCEFEGWNWTNGSTWVFYNFTPLNNETGNYTVEFYVEDNGTTNQPFNANTSTIVIIKVRAVNDAPNLTYVCDGDRNATENSPFNCTVNATDEDELYNLTFDSNYSWFLNNVVDKYNVSLDVHANATINFTPSDSIVGNWSIEVTVTDTGNSTHEAILTDSQIINFEIYNINDTPVLNNIPDQISYVFTPFSEDITAEDDDLLVPDKDMYNEVITFSYTSDCINGPCTTNLTLIINKGSVSGNSSPATITFTPNEAHVGNHTVNISITDISSESDWKIFNIEVENNSPAQWNTTLISSIYNLTEDITFDEINLSNLSYDTDDTDLNFSYVLLDTFPSFTLDGDTGIISFTPKDADSGVHDVNISVTDGKGIDTYHTFRFNVSYTLEAPVLDAISNKNATEDQLFIAYINATDGDIDIPDSLYAENLTFSDNTSLFNITMYNVSGNVTKAIINFTPSINDVGQHSINITVTDLNGSSSTVLFNLTVLEINDPPYFLHNISDQVATENQTFYLDINATDEEYGNESSGNLTFTCNISWINNSMNHTTGVINGTPNSSHIGIYSVKINVTDIGGASNSTVFNITVYEANKAPNITGCGDDPCIWPNVLNRIISEDSIVDFLVKANDDNFGSPNYDNLTVIWKFNGVVVKNETGYTDNTNWANYTYNATFQSETENGSPHRLAVIFNDSQGLEDNYTWNVTVDHVNAPPTFINTILNQSGTSGLQIDLDDYFYDEDHVDTKYNQSIDFTWVQYDYVANWSFLNESNFTESTQMGTDLEEENYTFTFTSGSVMTKLFKITAIDSNDSSMNVSSNIFQVSIVPGGGGRSGSSGSGGGTTTVEKIVSINIITPGHLKSYTNSTLVSWIILENDGHEHLTDINLNLSHTDGLFAELNETYLEKLGKGEKKNLTLTIKSFNRSGDEEVIIQAKSGRPIVSDKAKIHITILKEIKEVVEEKIAFTEQLITDNPACLDLVETIELAKQYYEMGNYQQAINLAEEAIQKCRSEVSQTVVKETREIPLLRPYLPIEFSLFLVLFIIAIIAVYYTRRYLLWKKGKGKFKSEEEIKIKVE
ncbi:MAG: hypothetical protein JSW73_03855 [Candidatus Woesearchaeota archaeon]|nr:MAG: hypothetical protein JSW73_03855 [Candidatus Woesearchaeota archaeon]